MYSRAYLLADLLIFSLMSLPGTSQASRKDPPPGSGSSSSSDEVASVIRTFTRMVTLEVVVKDSKGNHVTGLKPEDFQVFEQTTTHKKGKREQRIATFREYSMSDLAAHDSGFAGQIPAGVYTNAVSSLKDPVPPTIILVDGLNTDPKYQGQVHAQMLKMLRQLPPDIPVAVFLLGARLRMVQDFTTDPKLLQAALNVTPAGVGVATIDPRDDPHSMGTVEENAGYFSHDLVEAAKEFDQKTFAAEMDTRVDRTIDALLSIGRHVAGYPGRKNLLWLSTAFPVALAPISDTGRELRESMFDADAGKRDYSVQIERLNAALSDARVAVYPMNIAGVQTLHLFEAETIPANADPYHNAISVQDAARRDVMMRGYEQETMQTVADGTGGAVCVGDNDLADCVRKAVDDSSRFYEIAYYPGSKDWNGEYRRIIVDAKVKGMHLEYRQGYFASPEGNDAGAKDDLQRAACEGSLDATAIFLAAKSLPHDPKETMKFYLIINPAALTFTASGDGRREVNLRVGVCTFDETGKPLHYMSDAVDQKLTAGEYLLLANHGLPHVVSIAGRRPTSVRLAIMDLPSGKIGSVLVNFVAPAGAAPVAAK